MGIADQMRVTTLPTDWGWAPRNNRLFRHMESMPRLPVPQLEHTLALYLQSVKPFLTATEYPRIKAGVDQFAASLLSRDLQARLLQHQAAREARWEQQGARPHAQRALSRACTAARLHTCMCKAQHAVP